MSKLGHLLLVLMISAAICSHISKTKSEEAPRLSDKVFRKYSDGKQNGVKSAYPLAQLPLLFKTITDSKSAADMYEKLNQEDSFPMSFIGDNSEFGKVHLYIFNVWVSKEAEMLGQNRVYVDMYYALPFQFEKRGHIQQPVEVHW